MYQVYQVIFPSPGLMLPGRAGPLDWNHWTCSADWVNRNIFGGYLYIQGRYSGDIGNNGTDQFEQLNSNCFYRFEQTPIASSGRLRTWAWVIGNLSIPVSGPVMPSYRAIGRYWSKLDLPITSDQPIKSIFLISNVCRLWGLNNNCYSDLS